MELRMYGLTNYQLTGIQKGIQFLHGVVEYSQMVNKIGGDTLDIYNDWANNHKTVILLNGGTTNHQLDDVGFPVGTLNNHVLSLDKMKVDFATFCEPDLGNQLTAVVFLVDERVFNKTKYPDFEPSALAILNSWKYKREFKVWTKKIGGQKNVFLRDFLKNFRLA